MRYRLIKPDWGKSGEIQGPNVIEGDNFNEDFLKEKNSKGYNVYYFPNHNSKPIDHNFLRGSDIDIFQYCFVDMDLKDGIYETCEEFVDVLLADSMPPNKLVFSGNGVHAYWNMANLDLNSYLSIQLRLIQKFRTDTSIWTALQLMRLPQTMNTKEQENYKLVTTKMVHDKIHDAEEFKLLLPELDNINRGKLEMHVKKLNGIEELENFDEEISEIPPKFLELLEKSRKVQDLWASEQGERSEADYHLAQILFDKEYSKQEALMVLLNTSKALSKGEHRKSYAMNVVTSAYMSKAKHTVLSASQRIKNGELTKRERGHLVKGPRYFDCMRHGWRTSEVLGLIGSPSAGKTTVTLDIFYNMIKNDPEDDSIFVFFSLEMEDYKIIEQWHALTQDSPHLGERFFVVSNEDEEGNSRYLNLQDIYNFVKDLGKVTGKRVKAVAIDHVGIINKSIDIKKKPDFGLSKRDDLGFGNNRTLTDRELTKFLKSMAKELDCFMVIQSQTTKEKASEGDISLGLGAAYGVAQFEWDMDYVMTIWQPLKRVRYKTDLTITAFQYCKNRYVNKGDSLQVFNPVTVYIDLDTGRFRELTDEEFREFLELDKEANILRKMAEKKESSGYQNSGNLGRVNSFTSIPGGLHEVKQV